MNSRRDLDIYQIFGDYRMAAGPTKSVGCTYIGISQDCDDIVGCVSVVHYPYLGVGFGRFNAIAGWNNSGRIDEPFGEGKGEKVEGTGDTRDLERL